jgi:ubiquitin-conjugating enzyme E2 Z
VGSLIAQLAHSRAVTAMASAGPSKSSSSSLARPVVGSSGTGRLPNSGVLRIQQELQALQKEPVPFIYVNADEEDITKIAALIVGPLDTPYAGGFFHFDIRVVSEYPMKPPQVVLRTTDGGRVRFNPNLYNTGKVCLSILGTWEGPAWSSAESLSSVLLSIQSLMCPKPYHNEPGYETRGDAVTIADYNDYIQYETLRVAVVGMLDHPSCLDMFPDVLERQFILWYDMYITIAEDLRKRREKTSYKDQFSSTAGVYNVTAIIESLQRIKTRILKRLQSVDEPPKSALNPAEEDRSGMPYAIDRLQDEHRLLLTQAPSGASASPRVPVSPFLWDATIMGPERTPWEGGLYSLEIRFSSQHPYRPPHVRFTTAMAHPNITKEGIPALDIIQTRWNSNVRLVTILKELQDMLASPCPLYPVNLEIAHLYRTDRRQYDRRARRIAQDG